MGVEVLPVHVEVVEDEDVFMKSHYFSNIGMSLSHRWIMVS